MGCYRQPALLVLPVPAVAGVDRRCRAALTQLLKLGLQVGLQTGAVFALEGSNSIAGVRAAFSEPIKGLGLAFGTSVAGVATSAMLGLMSSLARRERALSSQQLDTLAHTQLQRFSLAHQRQESYQALQQQAQALPQVLQHLQALMAQIASSTEQTHTQLLASQHSFQQMVQREVHSAYTGLAQSVDQSLRTSLSQSLQLASDGIRPVVQATMAQLAEQAQTLNERLLHNTLPRVWERRLAEERARKPTLHAYMSCFGAGPVQFDQAKLYLCGAGACNKGLELILQLRTGSLPLASLTGKFGRSRRDDPTEAAPYCCPACSSGTESVAHFLLDCPAYESRRGSF
jgi:hypothetical protein